MTQHITITPNVRNGKPHIIGRRITVAEIAFWHVHQEIPIEEIVNEYDVTYGDVYGALTYYYDHRDAIEADIQEAIQQASEIRQQITKHNS
jgi:uncharacterized protein (DUF433 family)